MHARTENTHVRQHTLVEHDLLTVGLAEGASVSGLTTANWRRAGDAAASILTRIGIAGAHQHGAVLSFVASRAVAGVPSKGVRTGPAVLTGKLGALVDVEGAVKSAPTGGAFAELLSQ